MFDTLPRFVTTLSPVPKPQLSGLILGRLPLLMLGLALGISGCHSRPATAVTPARSLSSPSSAVAQVQASALYKQARQDCGPRALLLVCQKLGVKTDLQTLRRMAGTTAEGTTLEGLQQAAQKLGLQAEGVQVSRSALPNTALPAIAWINHNHYAALLALDGRGDAAAATIHDPSQTEEKRISQEQLLQQSSGFLLLVHR